MDADDLRRRATPEGLPPLLAALWHDARGAWERAHEIAQSDGSREAAWLHAYLHRKEGDLPNADYWYRRAGQPRPAGPLDAEWAALAAALSRPGDGERQ
jgi:hypothetical protein